MINKKFSQSANINIILLSYLILFLIASVNNIINRNNLLFFVFIIVIWINFWVIFYIIEKLGPQNNISSEIIILGVLIGILLNFTPISLSDDIYRYLFDGFLIQNEINPYLFEPSNVSISNISKNFVWFNDINNVEVPSPYPPLFIAFSYIFTQVFQYNLIIWRILMNLFTLLTALYLRKILIQLKMNPNFVILWSLNPNVLLEFNHNGHNDVIAIFLFVFGIYYLNKGDENKKFLFLSGLLFSLSIGIKIFPIFIIPFLVNKIKLGIIPLIISIFTQFFIFISSVNYEISGIRVFLEYWRFNGGLYEISDYVLNIIDNSFNNVNIETILRPIFSIIFIFIFISLIIFHYVGKNDKINDYYLISISYLVLFIFSPVLHPWYLLWALIPIILSENKFIFYWIFLFTINFSYLFYFCNCDNIVIILIEYLPIFLFLIGILLHKLNSILIFKKKAKFN